MNLAQYIDHTNLSPIATAVDVSKLCQEAVINNFSAVCISPIFVQLAAQLLQGTSVQVATVIGFPSGVVLPEIKVAETKAAIRDGADEIDMVLNLAAAKAGDWGQVTSDISDVVAAAEGRIVKVILETGLLTQVEKRLAAESALTAGAHYVKTSTGFNGGGATVEDVALLKQLVGQTMLIKASGGIRTREQALAMIKAGANRIGTSAGIAIAVN